MLLDTMNMGGFVAILVIGFAYTGAAVMAVLGGIKLIKTKREDGSKDSTAFRIGWLLLIVGVLIISAIIKFLT